jgi:hypothetical protein
MDLILAMASLPGWEEGTATGAIVYDWREICGGAQERRGDDGEEKGVNCPVFKQTLVHFTELGSHSFKHFLP